MPYVDRSKTLRNRVFEWVACVVFAVYLLNDYYDWRDPCLVAYEFTMFFAFLCLFMASWWRLQVRKTSDVLKWLIIMIAGTMYSTALQWWARMLNLSREMVEYQEFMRSEWWHYRMMPLLASLIYMAALIYARLEHKDQGE